MFMCKVRSLYVTVPLATPTSNMGPSQRVKKILRAAPCGADGAQTGSALLRCTAHSVNAT